MCCGNNQRNNINQNRINPINRINPSNRGCPCIGNNNNNQGGVNPNAPGFLPDCACPRSIVSRRIRTIPRFRPNRCQPRSIDSNLIRTATNPARFRCLQNINQNNPNINRENSPGNRDRNRSRGCHCGTRRPNAFFG